MDPCEYVFYAGGRDGNIYVAALHAESSSSSNYGKHIISAFNDRRLYIFLLHVYFCNFLHWVVQLFF